MTDTAAFVAVVGVALLVILHVAFDLPEHRCIWPFHGRIWFWYTDEHGRRRLFWGRPR
jgi:hypothetical protein